MNPCGTPGPTWLHGLDQRLLTVAPTFEQVAGDIERLLRDRVLVAHNLRFDWNVLRRSFADIGVTGPVTPAGVCTAKLAARVLEGAAALGPVCRRLGIDLTTPHRARADAVATADVFRALSAAAPTLVRGRPLPVLAGAWRLPRSEAPVSRAVALELIGNSTPALQGDGRR